jgi:outer membrane protein OmpA-like peptidoglycan-associated protein
MRFSTERPNALRTGLAAGLCLAAAGLPALAQDLSPDEINAMFNRQIEVLNQPLTRSLGGNQTARGLSLITVEDIQAEAVSPQTFTDAGPSLGESAAQTGTALPASSSGAAASGTVPVLAPITETLNGATVAISTTPPEAPSPAAATTEIAPIADPNAPLVYAKLAPEFQINLQIKFGYDSAALDDSQKTKLSTMCTAMRTSTIGQFRIIGHTDTSGPDEYNQRLSVLRAKEVARHLVEDCGIEPQRLETVGMGERFPVNDSNPRAEENRRVEFQAMS